MGDDPEIGRVGSGYAVFAGGVRVSAIYRSEDACLTVLAGYRRRWKKSLSRVRHCMTCGCEFTSEGIHNRICKPCKARSDRGVGSWVA